MEEDEDVKCPPELYFVTLAAIVPEGDHLDLEAPKAFIFLMRP